MKGTLPPSRRFEFSDTEVRSLRKQFGLTQEKFAHLVGISVGTLRNWEQGRRKPEGPARVLLKVAAVHPETLLDIASDQNMVSSRPTSRSSRNFRKRAAG
jgi:putative transcriptional regulator